MIGTLAIAAILCTTKVFAQNQASSPPRVPDAAAVSAAFTTVREWVNHFETPRMDDAASRVPMNGATGVCLVLRRSGRVLGVGTDTTGDDLMLRRAAGRALNDVLSDPALSSLTSRLRQKEVNDPNTPLSVDAFRSELGKSIVIELEVAGRLSPLVGKSIEALAQKLIPGIDGIGLRVREEVHLSFPAQWRATNAGGDTGRLLLSAALAAGVSVKDINDLPDRDDVAFYGFRTVTLWQSMSDQSPVQTHRGDVRVPLESVNAHRIVQFADAMTNHLMASMWPQETPTPEQPRQALGMTGDYSIVADQYRPVVAPPLDQALVAFSLLRYARALDRGLAPSGVDEATALKARTAAIQILRDLATAEPGEENPLATLAACAATVYAVTELPNLRNDQSVAPLFEEALKRLRDSFDPAAGFIDRSATDGRARTIPAHTQAMLAGAMTRLLTSESKDDSHHRARQAIDSAWRAVPQSQQVALLPWIGWAEQEYAAATKRPLHHADELRWLIEVLDLAMIDLARSEEPDLVADLEGGLALKSDGGSEPAATAQTVRPAAWLAGALADKTLLPPDRLQSHQKRMMKIMRFLIQLSVRPEHTGWLRNPPRAMGGLRAALWDSDQPLPAQALGLITAVDALRSLREQP